MSRSFSAAVCCKLLPEFLCRCLLAIFFPPVFFPSDLRLIFFRAVFLLVFLQQFFLRKFICMCCFFAYVFCSDVFSGRLLASVFSENLLSTPFCANIFFADVSFQDFFPHTLLFHIPFPEYFQGSRFLAHALFFHTPFPDYLCEQQVSCTCFLCCFFQRFSAPVVFEECSPEFLLHCNFFLRSSFVLRPKLSLQRLALFRSCSVYRTTSSSTYCYLQSHTQSRSCFATIPTISIVIV